MAFTDYTTPDNVRAVLGISAMEVADNVITRNVYLTGLLEALRALSPTLAADYTALKTAGGTHSADESRFLLLAETFCSYTVAVQLVPNLPMSAPQTITDGKSQQGRIANPYEGLLPSLNTSLAIFKFNLMDAYSDINPAIPAPIRTVRTMVTAVGLATDPVTGV